MVEEAGATPKDDAGANTNVAFGLALSLTSSTTFGALMVLFHSIGTGEAWRITCAALGFAVFLGMLVLIVVTRFKQRPWEQNEA
jgi:hypothetical protein